MKLKQFKKLIVFIGTLLITSYAFAKDETSAKEVINHFHEQLIEVMKEGKQLGYEGRYKKLYDPVNDSHDLAKIARIVVGKDGEKLSEAQQQQLIDVFTKLSVASYAHNFKEYSGESFAIDSEEETARGGKVVHAHLSIPNEKEVKFDYMLKEKGTSWRIINIIANGVSDLALKRSEYTSILEREGFDALIAKINEKIENYSKL